MANKNLWKTAGMAVVLWNPTNEAFDMQYAGRSFTLESGQKEEVNEACANHLLNAFGQRGLTFLKYGDNEDAVGADARARNLAFKKRQVELYNTMNEQRKMTRMGYLPPNVAVRKYAIELGIELLEPYTLKDEEKAAIAETSMENEILKRQVAKLTETMNQLLEKLSRTEERDEPPADEPSQNGEAGIPNTPKPPQPRRISVIQKRPDQRKE